MSLEYWIVRWSLSSGRPGGRTGWRTMTAGIQISNSHVVGTHSFAISPRLAREFCFDVLPN
jgi:hypothetical protein